MSRYCKVETQFTDRKALIASLIEVGGWTTDQIEVCCTPINLVGFKNDIRQEKADIIIRRKHIGKLSNDLGFVLNNDNCYEAIISEYDSRRFNKVWVGKLKGCYAYHKLRIDMEPQGRSVSRQRLPNGRQRLTVIGYR